MAAIYNFTQVPLTLPLQAAVKNRHGRRVIRGEEKEEKRIFFFFRKKGRNFENISIYCQEPMSWSPFRGQKYLIIVFKFKFFE